MSVAIEIKAEGIEAAMAAIAAFENLDRGELLEGIGSKVESQTKRRIMSEKTAPDGSAWESNNADNPVMVLTGALHDDIAYEVAGDTVLTGASLVYAAQRQFGGIIKAKDGGKLVFTVNGQKVAVDQVEQPGRAYLGLSGDNSNEIETMVADFLEALAP